MAVRGDTKSGNSLTDGRSKRDVRKKENENISNYIDFSSEKEHLTHGIESGTRYE